MKKLSLEIISLVILLIIVIGNFASTAWAVNNTIDNYSVHEEVNNINNEVNFIENETQFDISNEKDVVQNNIDIEKIENTILNDNSINETVKEITNFDTNSTVEESNEIKVSNDILEETSINDNSKVNQKYRELLENADIKDVNQLSTRINTKKMKNIMMDFTETAMNIDECYTNSDSGSIWIEEESREFISTFLNNHSSYTYSINNNGYLICDGILRNNEKFDFAIPQETEVDIAINNVLNSGKNIIINISDNYYIFDENENIISINFDNNIRSKAYENNDTRVIILNSYYYNLDNIEFNLPLSDNFIKILDNIQYKVLIGEIEFSVQNNTSEGISTMADFSDYGQAMR